MSFDNKNSNQEAQGCWQFLSLVIMVFGLFMMYPKTAELQARFAPSTWFGYLDMEATYGMFMALLIEGIIAVMKIKLWLFTPRGVMQWFWDCIVILSPFLISGFSQVFDSFFARGEISSLPENWQIFIAWAVPLMPVVMVGLFVVMSLIETAPPQIFGGMRTGHSGNFNLGFLRSWADGIRDWANDKKKNGGGNSRKPIPNIMSQQKDFTKPPQYKQD